MNLDAMDHAELVDFWSEAASHPVRVGRRLFPDMPKGYVAATKKLAHYALSKASAIACRLKGEIGQAQRYEGNCEAVFEALAEYARW